MAIRSISPRFLRAARAASRTTPAFSLNAPGEKNEPGYQPSASSPAISSMGLEANAPTYTGGPGFWIGGRLRWASLKL